MSFIDPKMVKVAVGLALEAEIERSGVRSRLSDHLLALYSNPNLVAIEALHEGLLGSDSFDDREVGLLLEPVVDRLVPEVDWRELVIDIQETELDVFNLAYLIETSMYRESFRAFGLLNWIDSLGNAVDHIRAGNWVFAKIYLNRAVRRSLDRSVEKLGKNDEFRQQIDESRKATKSDFDRALVFPCQSSIPEDRLDLILEVQGFLVELSWKYSFEPADRILSDIVSHLIERLGVAEDCLLDRRGYVEQASYEISLAAEHLEQRIRSTQDKRNQEVAMNLQKRIELLFSHMLSESAISRE